METVIIGPAQAGKTTIFNALTGQTAPTGDFSAAKKQAHLADVQVPDSRIDRLSAMFKPKKTTYASVHFRDQPLEYGQDASMTTSGLNEARRADTLVLVIRGFESGSVPHPLQTVNPLRDARKALESLVLADYEVAEKRLARLEKEAKKDTREHHVLSQIVEMLGSGRLLGRDYFNPEDAKLFSGFGFLTVKPIFLVLNTGEKTVEVPELTREALEKKLELFPIRGDLEMEIAQLAPEDQKAFLADLGLEEPAKNRFIRAVYSSLSLQSFFTTGEDEVRAWSIREGTTAVKAAGVIHSDLEKGFIRAEVVPWQEMLESGDKAKKPKPRLEGKDYVVKDGDILMIRFNV